MKDWTEPNGIFIVNIPIEWQYKNVVVQNCKEESPYSFEPYEDSSGCFQLSCYPLLERGINSNFPVQKNNSKVKWHASRTDDEEFDMLLFYAQVDDQFCMAKYIYSANRRFDIRIKEQIQKVHYVLDTFRVIPQSDRLLAANLNKYDNFFGSLVASHDLAIRSIESESYIELIVILANQIDAFLRLSIILKQQLSNESDDIEVKYLYEADGQNGMIERKIYSQANELEIIDNELYTELNGLYDQRNRVIHRYIISYLKTRKIAQIAYDYAVINEKVKLILRQYEEMQFGKGYGIFGRGYSKNYEFDEDDKRRAFSLANDKHLLEKLQRIL